MNTIRKHKWVFAALVLLLVVALVVSIGRSRSENVASADGQGETAVAFIGDLSANATAAGHVSALREAQLSLAASGKVAEIPVTVGDRVSKGDLLLQVETRDLEHSVASAEYDLAIAEAQLADLLADPSPESVAASEAAVRSAQAKLDDLRDGPSAEEIAASEASVNATQAGIWSASGSLAAVQEVSQADIAAAQKELDTALDEQRAAHDAWVNLADCKVNDAGSYTCTPKKDNEKMEAATEEVQRANAQVAIKQAQLDELLNPDENQVASSQAGIGSASAQYDAALARHNALLAGATEAEIAAAEYDLSSAQASLDSLLAGPEETDIAIYETRVAQARTALQEAQNALADAAVIAPFDGVITAVHAAPGEFAEGLVIEMIANGGLEVVLNVDEIDIGKLAVGQPAVVTLETWPDVELQSEIAAIAPRANDSGSGAVSYDVHLVLPQTDLPVLVGMTANADLVTGTGENVLLVPNAAVSANRREGTFSVTVVRTDEEGNPQFLPVEVTVGLRDSRFTQITSGLLEGDQVALGELAAPVLTFDGPGRRGQ